MNKKLTASAALEARLVSPSGGQPIEGETRNEIVPACRRRWAAQRHFSFILRRGSVTLARSEESSVASDGRSSASDRRRNHWYVTGL